MVRSFPAIKITRAVWTRLLPALFIIAFFGVWSMNISKRPSSQINSQQRISDARQLRVKRIKCRHPWPVITHKKRKKPSRLREPGVERFRGYLKSVYFVDFCTDVCSRSLERPWERWLTHICNIFHLSESWGQRDECEPEVLLAFGNDCYLKMTVLRVLVLFFFSHHFIVSHLRWLYCTRFHCTPRPHHLALTSVLRVHV